MGGETAKSFEGFGTTLKTASSSTRKVTGRLGDQLGWENIGKAATLPFGSLIPGNPVGGLAGKGYKSIFGSNKKDPWEEAGLSWAEWTDRNRVTFEKLGINRKEFKLFQLQPEYKGLSNPTGRPEESNAILDAFALWQERMGQEKTRRKQYIDITQKEPGRDSTVLTEATTLLG